MCKENCRVVGKGEKFTCVICGGIFTNAWTEEEAIAEKDSLWGDTPIEECSTACDKCFNEIVRETDTEIEQFFNNY